MYRALLCNASLRRIGMRTVVSVPYITTLCIHPWRSQYSGRSYNTYNNVYVLPRTHRISVACTYLYTARTPTPGVVTAEWVRWVVGTACGGGCVRSAAATAEMVAGPEPCRSTILFGGTGARARPPGLPFRRRPLPWRPTDAVAV